MAQIALFVVDLQESRGGLKRRVDTANPDMHSLSELLGKLKQPDPPPSLRPSCREIALLALISRLVSRIEI